ALVWLKRTFGFTEHYRYGESDERVEGAQMRLGDAWIMLNSVRPGRASPAQLGSQTQSLTLFVANVGAHFEHAKSAGAKIVEELHETVYGERQYGAEALEGHRWSSHSTFATSPPMNGEQLSPPCEPALPLVPLRSLSRAPG